ncbi:MAG: BPSL0067 family protein [Azoarcus sp.]|jgi:hypothetical protein|nr:BPSL0067 family protein [Azoarcus sp.]
MSFHVNPVDLEKALNGTHPFCNGGWVTAPADRATGNESYTYGCVTAVKALTGAPGSNDWRRGKKVKGNSITKGTAIATFAREKEGHYAFKEHAAIFDGYEDGLAMYDQWWSSTDEKRKRFSRRIIPFTCGGYVSNDGEAFYVIELTEDPNGDPIFCGLTSTAGG